MPQFHDDMMREMVAWYSTPESERAWADAWWTSPSAKRRPPSWQMRRDTEYLLLCAKRGYMEQHYPEVTERGVMTPAKAIQMWEERNPREVPA